MNITVSGKGPSIVFIHGFCESLNIWKAFEQLLSKQFQIVLIDLPGHGKSPLKHPDFSIDDIADQVHDELMIRGIDQYFLIGHSLGGYVSLALADLYEEHVNGLGLFSSTTFADDEDKKKVRDKVKNYILEHGVKSFMESFVAGLFAPANQKKLAREIDILKLEACNTPPESVIGYSMAMKNRPDRTAILGKFKKPVFVIAGERDMAVKLEISKKMIDLIQNGDSLILKGAGHNGFLENEKESLEFINSFLSKYLM
ncbi:MAG: alpha/beta hydrolase [Reichenbachiella sp.]